jgi:hypothetical protein
VPISPQQTDNNINHSEPPTKQSEKAEILGMLLDK